MKWPGQCLQHVGQPSHDASLTFQHKLEVITAMLRRAGGIDHTITTTSHHRHQQQELCLQSTKRCTGHEWARRRSCRNNSVAVPCTADMLLTCSAIDLSGVCITYSEMAQEVIVQSMQPVPHVLPPFTTVPQQDVLYGPVLKQQHRNQLANALKQGRGACAEQCVK